MAPGLRATALCTLRCYDHYIQMLSRDTGREDEMLTAKGSNNRGPVRFG